MINYTTMTDSLSDKMLVEELQLATVQGRRTQRWKDILLEINECFAAAKDNRRSTPLVRSKNTKKDADLTVSARVFWLHGVGEDGIITLFRSYKTWRTYISKEYAHIFKPTAVGTGPGRRYYLKTYSIADFVYLFETNQL